MNQKIAKILICQTKSSVTDRFGSLFQPEHFKVHKLEGGQMLLDHIKNEPPADLILIDSSVEEHYAIQTCRTIKADANLFSIPILLLWADSTPERQKQAIEAGCDDILIEPILPNVLMARIRSLLRVKFLIEDLDSAESVLYTLARTIEAKDQYTMGHADRVANYAIELGKRLGVGADDIEILRKGGMLHDIGKIAIPDAILTKPGKFAPDEFEVMKRHPVIGCDICDRLKSVKGALPLIRHHHEKLDGSGYPDGLKGEAIPYFVRIISIVDIYDALRSKRSYKEAFSVDKTFEIMWQEVEKGWWDKDIVSAWEKHVRQRHTDPF